MSQLNLSGSLVKDVLRHLDCPVQEPTLRYLNRLIHAYIRKVPWESVSRILKRHATASTSNCPRWPEEFWREAMQYGFGGTCYESSLAFHCLLTALGFEGCLTINDMGDSRGCHAAIVIVLKGGKYLVDNTIPVHAAVRIDPRKTTRRNTSLLDYTIRPVSDDKYEVERSPHPSRYAFTLIDTPVSLSDYRRIVENDYSETGLFLKSVVMVKVIDGKTWRFFSDHKPYRLESFNRSGRLETYVKPEAIPSTLSGIFHIPADSISTALSLIEAHPVEACTQVRLPFMVAGGYVQ